jgi:ribosomal protein S18 acetylase RimI-like enzyme
MLDQMLRIRRMRLGDIPFAIRLTNLEKWGVSRADLERLIFLNPKGNFIASLDGGRVGMMTTMSYGKKIGWVGNVVVMKSLRGQNIGKRLMEHAVSYLRSSGVRRIALYCFSDNVRFYMKLGFVRDKKFFRLRRTPQISVRRSEIDPKKQPSLTRMLTMDREAFGADRSKLLQRLVTEKLAVIFDSGGRSYLIVKSYSDMSEFGPWVGITPFDKNDDRLIKYVTTRYGRKPIEASCLASNGRILKLLRKEGFQITNVGFRMYHAKKEEVGHDQANYLLGFLDKG